MTGRRFGRAGLALGLLFAAAVSPAVRAESPAVTRARATIESNMARTLAPGA